MKSAARSRPDQRRATQSADQRLDAVAEKAGLAETLRQGFERTKVAAFGPVVAAELADLGISPDTMPDTSYSMKPLVQAILRLFAADACGR